MAHSDPDGLRALADEIDARAGRYIPNTVAVALRDAADQNERLAENFRCLAIEAQKARFALSTIRDEARRENSRHVHLKKCAIVQANAVLEPEGADICDTCINRADNGLYHEDCMSCRHFYGDGYTPKDFQDGGQ